MDPFLCHMQCNEVENDFDLNHLQHKKGGAEAKRLGLYRVEQKGWG